MVLLGRKGPFVSYLQSISHSEWRARRWYDLSSKDYIFWTPVKIHGLPHTMPECSSEWKEGMTTSWGDGRVDPYADCFFLARRAGSKTIGLDLIAFWWKAGCVMSNYTVKRSPVGCSTSGFFSQGHTTTSLFSHFFGIGETCIFVVKQITLLKMHVRSENIIFL